MGALSLQFFFFCFVLVVRFSISVDSPYTGNHVRFIAAPLFNDDLHAQSKIFRDNITSSLRAIGSAANVERFGTDISDEQSAKEIFAKRKRSSGASLG